MFECHGDSDLDEEEEIDKENQDSQTKFKKRTFPWRQRRPVIADVDPEFRGPDFLTPPEEIPGPKWYFAQFMDQSVFEYISEQTNLQYMQP